MMLRRRLRLFYCSAPILLSACADPSGPSSHEHPQRLLIAGTEDGAVVVDLDWRGIVRRSGPRYVAQGPAILNGRGDLITVGRLEGGETVMAGLDIESGLELWRTAISLTDGPRVLDGIELGASTIAANPSRPEVFLFPATRDGVGGIAGFDYDRQRVTRFIGPTGGRFRAMTGAPATPERPSGCLVMALDGGSGNEVRAFLHVVCGSTYAERDSIALPLPSHVVLQMETSSNGQDLLVMTDAEYLRFDATTFELVRRATRPLASPFFLSQSTRGLIVPDVGTSLVASSGIIYLLDAGLELSGIIDLRVLPFDERPLGILGAEESSDGRWLYVVGGVPRDGPAYGPEETHVLVIEKATGTVKDVLSLSTFGGGRPILVP